MLPEFDHRSHSGHKQQEAEQNGEPTPDSHVSDVEMIAGWLSMTLMGTLPCEQELATDFHGYTTLE